MSWSRISRHRAVLGFVAGGAVVALCSQVGPVSAAVRGSLGSGKAAGFTACATTHRALELTANGTCEPGSHKVTVGARGPAGPRGRTGAPGVGQAITFSHTYAGTPDPTVLRHQEPPGQYVLAWSVQFAGNVDLTGVGSGKVMSLLVQCQPFLRTGSGVDEAPIGSSDVLDASTEEPYSYDGDSNTSSYGFARSLTGTLPWEVFKNTSLVLECGAQVKDQAGNLTPLDHQEWFSQITLTKISKVVDQPS